MMADRDSSPAAPRGQAGGAAYALARLWSAPDPELTNQGFVVEPQYLLERLEDPDYAQRYYTEGLGGPVGPETPDVPDAPEVPEVPNVPTEAAA
jgi:hypothetical protein